jgi:hypothetical protein
LGRQALGLRLHRRIQVRVQEHRGIEEGALLAISAPRFDFIGRLHHTQATDPALVAIHDEVCVGTCAVPWTVVDDMVTYGGRLYIPPTSPLL